MTRQSSSFFTPSVIVSLWILLSLTLLLYLYNHLQIKSDISFFLPEHHSSINEVMKHQLKEGEAGKFILLGLSFKKQPSDTAQAKKTLAKLNQLLSSHLKQTGRFALVQNGQQDINLLLPQLFYDYRYLITQDKQFFSSTNLSLAFNNLLQRLEMMLTPIEQKLFAEDPLMIWLNLLQQWQPQNLPKHHDVWFDQAGNQTLLFVKSNADAYDLKQQRVNIDLIYQYINTHPEFSDINLLLSGSPVFALESQKSISRQIQIVSVIASVTLMAFLFWFFRSIKIVVLISLPLIFAILAGLTTVIFFNGFIHGITLAFGITIIGIAVDYPIHYYSHQLFLIQNAQIDKKLNIIKIIWPKIRLGLITTIIGFSAITLSEFSGLKQLGLFAISGLLTAALVTRFLLPQIYISNKNLKYSKTVPFESLRKFINLPVHSLLKILSFLLPLFALIFLVSNHDRLWQNDLSALSPIPESQKQLDFNLRKAMALPELRYALLMRAPDPQILLQLSEKIRPFLERLKHSDTISGYDMAANYLPSIEQQKLQQKQLPSRTELKNQLEKTLKDTPLDSSAFLPFVEGVAKSKTLPPLDLQSVLISNIDSTNFIHSKLSTLIYQQTITDGTTLWTTIIPLQGVKSELTSHPDMQHLPGSFSLLDLKVQSEIMLVNYRNNALFWFVCGSFLIIIILFSSRPKATALLKLIWPFFGAVLLTVTTLLATGYSLSIFHLVTLLLVVGLAIDYSIFTFFSHREEEDSTHFTEVAKVSVIICLVSTLIMFGALGLSDLPVLKAIGLTAILGAFYAFWLTLFVNRQP